MFKTSKSNAILINININGQSRQVTLFLLYYWIYNKFYSVVKTFDMRSKFYALKYVYIKCLKTILLRKRWYFFIKDYEINIEYNNCLNLFIWACKPVIKDKGLWIAIYSFKCKFLRNNSFFTKSFFVWLIAHRII